jgi:hypothetical protein
MLSGYTLLTQWSGFFFFLSNYVIAFGTGGDVYVKGIYIYIYIYECLLVSDFDNRWVLGGQLMLRSVF